MKHMRYIKIIGIISALLFLISCGGGSGGGAASVGSSIITLTIGGTGPTAKVKTGQDTLFANLLSTISPGEAEAGGVVVPLPDLCGIPREVHMIRFIIEGSGMDTITRDVLVNGQCEIIETFDVPNGPSRNFIALAFDINNVQTHAGNTFENVPAPNNYVPIFMKSDVVACDLYVDINNNVGDFSNDCTDPSEPCETITHALHVNQTPLGNETICVFPGTYFPEKPDIAIGELYPLNVDRNIKLLCVDHNLNLNSGRGCILDGEIYAFEVYAPEGVVISDTATISNFTIIHFPAIFYGSGFTGVNVIGGQPIVKNNIIRDNVTGVAVFGGDPQITGNNIINNTTGITISFTSGTPVISGNTIACNIRYDLDSNKDSGTIEAPNNAWDNNPPNEFARGDADGCPGFSDDICHEGALNDVTVNVTGYTPAFCDFN